MMRFYTRTRALLGSLGALGAAGVLTAGLAAGAVSPTPEAAPNGNAGYNASTSSATGFTNVQSVVSPTQYASTIKTGAQGVQLCVSPTAVPHPNLAAQVGLVSANTSTTFSVASAVGVLPAPGCPTAGVLSSPVPFPGLANVPYGHHVWVSATKTTRVRTVRVLICVRSGRGFICRFRVITIPRGAMLFEAQDLDAPAIAQPGDLQGVQTRITGFPASAILSHADVGVNENQTPLVACSGVSVFNGVASTYPRSLAGPAAYVSAACQPVTTEGFSTAADGAGPATPITGFPALEGVSPGTTAATPALVAPNNSATAANTGPHGTASNASTAGDQITIFTGNTPTT